MLVCPAFGQGAPPQGAEQPSRNLPQADHEQFVGSWTTETGWYCELQLRNNLAGNSLTVTPALRTADGTETKLASVTIQPQEVKAIDLDTAIGTAAPQLIGTYGSVV